MPQVTITISAEHLTRLVDALCARFNYRAEIEDVNGVLIPNPQSRNEFALEKHKELLVKFVRGYEYDVAQAALAVTDITIS